MAEIDTERAHPRRAQYDACDDGRGPMFIALPDREAAEREERAWTAFKAWAVDNLGRGYSLACCDGAVLDPVTHWSFVAFKAALALREEPMEMPLCDSHKVTLQIGRPYVFRPVDDCESCTRLAAAAREAYGPTGRHA